MSKQILSGYVLKFSVFFLSIIGSLIFLECILQVWSAGRSLRSRMEVRASGAFIVLTLGESTTSSEYPGSWPSQLSLLLKNAYPGMPIQIINKAKSGIQSSEAIGNIEHDISVYKPNVIISMIGINDSPLDFDNTSLYAPVTGKEMFKTVKLVRLLYRYAEIGLSRYRDFVLEPSVDRLNAKATAYQKHGLYEYAELYLNESLKHNPENPDTYRQLSYVYRETDRLIEAKRALLHLVSLEPKNDMAYVELGVFYRDTIHDSRTASSYFEEALRLNDRNGQAYFDYGMNILYLDELRASELLEKAIMLRPDLMWAYFYRAELYERSGNNIDAERIYELALKREPGNEIALMKRAQIYNSEGSGDVAGAEDSQPSLYGDMKMYKQTTIQNYSRLISVATDADIPLIIMQYPLQPVEPLHQMIDELVVSGHRPRVIGNVENFKEALRSLPYDALFVDKFGGNFGHATQKGNAMIAKNIFPAVNAILMEYLKK